MKKIKMCKLCNSRTALKYIEYCETCINKTPKCVNFLEMMKQHKNKEENHNA